MLDGKGLRIGLLCAPDEQVGQPAKSGAQVFLDFTRPSAYL